MMALPPLAEAGGVVAHCDQCTHSTAAALFSVYMVYCVFQEKRDQGCI
jgi:hypothetical protein